MKAKLKYMVLIQAALMTMLFTAVVAHAEGPFVYPLVLLYPDTAEYESTLLRNGVKHKLYRNETLVDFSEVKFTKIKTSNPKVLTLRQKKVNGYYYMYLRARKAGKATISYYSGEYKSTYKITVKKYESPFEYIKIGNLNLTNQFKKSPTVTLSYKKYAGKKLKVTYKLKKKNGIQTSSVLSKIVSDSKYVYYSDKTVKSNKTYKVTVKKGGLGLSYTYKNTNTPLNAEIIFK